MNNTKRLLTAKNRYFTLTPILSIQVSREHLNHSVNFANENAKELFCYENVSFYNKTEGSDFKSFSPFKFPTYQEKVHLLGE